MTGISIFGGYIRSVNAKIFEVRLSLKKDSQNLENRPNIKRAVVLGWGLPIFQIRFNKRSRFRRRDDLLFKMILKLAIGRNKLFVTRKPQKSVDHIGHLPCLALPRSQLIFAQ